jgi:hypothetical protein
MEQVTSSCFGDQEVVTRWFVEAHRKEKLENRQFNRRPEPFQPLAGGCLTWPSQQPAHTSDRGQE